MGLIPVYRRQGHRLVHDHAIVTQACGWLNCGSVESRVDELQFDPQPRGMVDEGPDDFEIPSHLAARASHEQKPRSDWYDSGPLRDWYKPRSWKNWRNTRFRRIQTA